MPASSGPASPARITAIEAPSRGSARRVLYLDGEAWRTTSKAVVAELDLGEDDLVEPDGLREALETAERKAGRNRAIGLLSYRERGEAELLRRLQEDGYESVAGEIVASLAAVGLVDDVRYAMSYARERLQARGHGAMRVRRELLAKGVCEEAVRQALEEASDSDEETRALEAAKRAIRPGRDRRKLAALLVRRGFGTGVALKAASQVLSDEGGEAEPGDLDGFSPAQIL